MRLESDPGQGRENAAFQRPVSLGEFVQGGLANVRPLELPPRLGHAEKVGDGFLRWRLHSLAEEAYASRDGDPARERTELAGHEPKEGGFSHAIAADEAGAFRPESEIQVREKSMPFRRTPSEIGKVNGRW